MRENNDLRSQSQPCTDGALPILKDAQHSGGKIAYRGWWISYDPPPIPVRCCDWQFWHEDYDGPEDNRSGYAGSLVEAKCEIDEREDDQ